MLFTQVSVVFLTNESIPHSFCPQQPHVRGNYEYDPLWSCSGQPCERARTNAVASMLAAPSGGTATAQNSHPVPAVFRPHLLRTSRLISLLTWPFLCSLMHVHMTCATCDSSSTYFDWWILYVPFASPSSFRALAERMQASALIAFVCFPALKVFLLDTVTQLVYAVGLRQVHV